MLVLANLSHYSTTSEGEHSGYVTAMERSGYLWHNWKVYFKTDNSSSQEDIYCLPEHSPLAEELKKANRERRQVTITYDGMRAVGFGLCDGEYITGVK